VFFLELPYSNGGNNINNNYTEISIYVSKDKLTWFVNRPSYSELIIQICIIIGATIPIPTLLRKFIHITSKMMNTGICGTIAAVLLLIITIIISILTGIFIVYLNEYSTTFSSLSIVSLIYTVTFFLCISTRLIWSFWLNSKTYREVHSETSRF